MTEMEIQSSQQSVEAEKRPENQTTTSKKKKPGQRYPTPSPGNGDRVFYESLYQQNPNSEMAAEWCVDYGILPDDTAQKEYGKICKRKGKPMGSSPTPTKK